MQRNGSLQNQNNPQAMRLVSPFPFFFAKTNVHHDGSTSKANDMSMEAAVCNIPHLEPREGELDRSGSHSN